MIELTGAPGDKSCKLLFTPRPAFRGNPKAPNLERDLIYGHRCPTCGNVIQACFLTDEEVNLWMYEETAFISTSSDAKKFGTLLKWVPNDESKAGYSQYTSTFYPTAQEHGQHIVLKNHIVRFHGIDGAKNTTDRYFEPGGHTCSLTGCFSKREDLVLKDMALLWRSTNAYVATMPTPGLEAFATSAGAGQQGVRIVPAYGQAPPALLFPRDKLTSTYSLEYQMRNMLEPFQPKEGTTV